MDHPNQQPTSALVLLSGGLDSATALAIARHECGSVAALSFVYGQRHSTELESAKGVARAQGVTDHRVVNLDPAPFAASALTGAGEVPKDRGSDEMHDIPSTYVPARNLVFLSIASALAESIGARRVYIGANEVDYSGYPDCRGVFLEAFEQAANLATRVGVEGDRIRVVAPLLTMTKAQIIQRGTALGVDYALTHSCYDPVGALACGRCDSCVLRREGFIGAGVDDPTRYADGAPS